MTVTVALSVQCSTTCEECDPKCANYKHCQAKCYARFHYPRKKKLDKEEGQLFPLSYSDIKCAIAVFLATVSSARSSE